MSIQKLLFVLLVGILSFSGLSSTKLYDYVMAYERYSAGLEKKSVTLDIGEIVYAEQNLIRKVHRDFSNIQGS